MKIPKFFKRDDAFDGEDLYNGTLDDLYGEPTANETGDDSDIIVNNVRSSEARTGAGLAFGGGDAPVSLKVIKPKGYEDAPYVADCLAAGSTVVLNIEDLNKENTIRLIDFLMGTIHVIGGTMENVTKTTLVFAPKNVGISGFESIADVD